MSKDESKRENQSDAQEISDEALEKVAGGLTGSIQETSFDRTSTTIGTSDPILKDFDSIGPGPASA